MLDLENRLKIIHSIYKFQAVSPEEDERPDPIENELDAEQDQRDFGSTIKGFASITPYQVRCITH